MPRPATNFRVLRPSRKKLRPGDVFAMQLPDERYLFGRVVVVDPIGPMGVGQCVLIYIYRHLGTEKSLPPRSEMSLGSLLIPPLIVNRLGWSRGYWEVIGNVPLDRGDVLEQHAFSTRVEGLGDRGLVDENGKSVPSGSPALGPFILVNYRWVDDRVSEALGIELAPE